MAKPTTEEKAAGKGPRVDLDQLETALGAPPDTAQPVHTEEDEPPMTNDNAAIIEQVNNRGERPDPLAATNPIEELVDGQTQEVLDGLEDMKGEIQRLIDDIRSSRTVVTGVVTEHARRTSLGAKAASTITKHLAEVRAEFAPKA